MANENIGIMEGAFFVSKNELINWVNDLLSLNLTKVEQMASGAAYCQIMDVMYPGSIQMSKINWVAQYDHEFVANYKLLQAAFDKQNIHKHIDVEKLIRAKYQDNLEFFQWFKRFFDLNCSGHSDYNPLERRKNMKTPWDSDKRDTRNRSNEKRSSNPSPKLSPRGPTPVLKIPVSPTSKVMSFEKLEKLESELKEIKENISLAEKEKNFYFEKLRVIMDYCDFHESKQNEYLMDLQKVLFASEEDHVKLNENGSISFN